MVELLKKKKFHRPTRIGERNSQWHPDCKSHYPTSPRVRQESYGRLNMPRLYAIAFSSHVAFEIVLRLRRTSYTVRSRLSQCQFKESRLHGASGQPPGSSA